MHKVWLIIQREFNSRVRTKSFIISTLLLPLAFIAIIVASIVIAIYGNEKMTIAVKDESGLFEDKFRGLDQGETLTFKYMRTSSIEELKEDAKNDVYSGVLYIPQLNIDQPKGIKYYSNNQMGPQTEDLISTALTDVIKTNVLKREGYDSELLQKLDEKVTFESIIKEKEKGGKSDISSGLGYAMGFVMYMFIFIYGAMVMKGVAEEKNNRIVEVMLSSIRPIQLLSGKVLGIGLVAILQSMLWFATIIGVQLLIGIFFAKELQHISDLQSQGMAAANETAIFDAIQTFKSLDLSRITISFFFYFIFGFLFYGAQFAAVGAAITDDSDANSYTMPIAMPIIIALIIMNVVIQQPNASLAIWSSMVPWFSPIIMLARIPFDISITQQIISMIILVMSSIAMLWLAGRIYRVGILIQGQKVSLKDMGKWIFLK
ncbi:MAG: ABC transporter permease [Chitinophagales bacterium]|nr:ABC transporter permease [Chitinophagales bacterium]MCZ2394878.1 ABC transporter permease [Chitinophagales bacterium]